MTILALNLLKPQKIEFSMYRAQLYETDHVKPRCLLNPQTYWSNRILGFMNLCAKDDSDIEIYVAISYKPSSPSHIVNCSLPDRTHVYNTQLIHLADFNCIGFVAPEVA